MADGGDGLPLARRGGGEQRPGGGEENGLPLALPHLAQEIAVEHGGRAAAAGGSGVHILVLPVIQQQAAVLELGAHVHTVPLEEVPDAPDNAPVPDDAAVSADNIEHLTELIGQMKPMYRDPLRLLAMGYTNREIAESLGLTDEVVRMRLFRGRKLLWKELNSHE